MNISAVLNTLIAEKVFKRTPSGRPLSEYAVEVIEATLEDQSNYEQEAIKCLNCNFIGSSLLVPEGCVSCGGKDLTTKITKLEVL